MTKIRLFSATQKSDYKSTTLYRSVNSYAIETVFKTNNTTSLAKLYNGQIKIAREAKVDFLVLAHDDVHINCGDVVDRIKHYGAHYNVFGLAGTTQITIKSPVLWHLMSKRDYHTGCVAHGHTNKYSYTSFGPVPSKAILIDGVFMCLNLNRLPDNMLFDEANPASFHFYDLNFSLDCSLNQITVGVGDIPIIHESPGLREFTQQWKDGEAYFLKKYEKYLGKTLTV